MDQSSATSARIIGFCALLLIVALYVVGVVSHGVLRHVVQTAPVWIVVWLGFRRSGWSKWAALPCFILWLFLMSLIWLFLLGLGGVLPGTLSPTGILMP